MLKHEPSHSMDPNHSAPFEQPSTVTRPPCSRSLPLAAHGTRATGVLRQTSPVHLSLGEGRLSGCQPQPLVQVPAAKIMGPHRPGRAVRASSRGPRACAYWPALQCTGNDLRLQLGYFTGAWILLAEGDRGTFGRPEPESSMGPRSKTQRKQEFEFFGPYLGPIGIPIVTISTCFALYRLCGAHGCASLLDWRLPPAPQGPWFTWQAMAVYLGWLAFQIVLHLLLPGRRVQGVPLPNGQQLTYKFTGRRGAALLGRGGGGGDACLWGWA